MTVNTGEPIKGYELKITRVFDAPRELVWKAWTDPAMAMQWMGPRGFETTEFVAGTEVGSRWHIRMQGKRPGAEQMTHLGQGGVVKEMRPPELLSYTFAWDERASVGLGDSPYKENLVTVRFEEKGSKTIMTFTQGPFATEGERDGHNGGWNSAFDCFAEFINAQQPQREPDPNEPITELHLKRFFAAPRQVVFDAWTKPEMLKEWWGPKNFTNPRCEFEAFGGGNIRIDMRAPDGTLYPMSGKVIEFYPPYRFHFTTSALDANGDSMFDNWNSVFFEEVEGGTQVTLDVHVMTMTEAAPQYLKGMRQGWSMSLDKLADFLLKA